MHEKYPDDKFPKTNICTLCVKLKQYLIIYFVLSIAVTEN